MKFIIIFSLLVFTLGCTSDNKESSDSESGSDIVTNFLNDVTSIEDVESKNPIVSFQESAAKIAEKVESITKDNIVDILEEAKEYKHCVIIIEDHTIVKIKDIEDCKQSGSWSACMPFAEGYIKKGELSYEEDYMNNIVGRPDSQERTAYLFK